MSTPHETTLSQDIGGYLRYQLRGWRGLIVAGVILAVPALWFGWPWLVAAGLAPLLLAMAPCALMCAVGLCMNRAGKKPNVGSSASRGADGSVLPHASAGSKSEPAPSLAACCVENDGAAETKAPR